MKILFYRIKKCNCWLHSGNLLEIAPTGCRAGGVKPLHSTCCIQGNNTYVCMSRNCPARGEIDKDKKI